jgi:predicted MFS family arabinose efflux permease
VGALSVGTDAYLTAGLLTDLSAGMHVSVAAAGQLVTAYTLGYALLAPLAGAVLGRGGLRGALLISLGVFAAANAACAVAPGFAALLAFRVLAGVGAGVFMPCAATSAAALAGPERRGRALTLVLGGLSCGTVLGVPLGLLLAAHLGWRAAFVLIAVLGAAAWAGVSRLPAMDGALMPGLRARLAVLRDGRVGSAVGATLLQTIASLGLYTYLVTLLHARAPGLPVALGLWLWGLGGVVGSLGIGPLLDRFGHPARFGSLLLGLLAAVLAGLAGAGSPVLPALLFLWGALGWAFVVPQQHRLLSADPAAGAAALALNSSATYLGGTLGAALGGAALALHVAPGELPLCAAVVALGGLGLSLVPVGAAAQARTEPAGEVTGLLGGADGAEPAASGRWFETRE